MLNPLPSSINICKPDFGIVGLVTSIISVKPSVRISEIFYCTDKVNKIFNKYEMQAVRLSYMF